MTAPASLSPAFVQWWFAPWDLAGLRQDAGAPAPRDLLGRRDAYRRWCLDAGIPAALPPTPDSRWAALATLGDTELARAARLFGGLFAARMPLPQALAGLEEDERRWCAGVANLQPLPRAPWRASTALEAGVDGAGLAWLALCLEHGFPGLWPRLRLRLPASAAAGAERCLQDGGVPPADAALARLARCWTLCERRAA
ncbi:hypothetical protein ACFOHT_05760 [Massilia oculi]|nr:hypothetical protein [Massilia oculi]